MERRPNTASQQTKQALAAALKELMAQKPIENITIHDLTEHCGIRRQTFYYHFEDIPDLMAWSLRRNFDRVIAQCQTQKNGEEALRYLLSAAVNARPMLKKGMQSNYGEELERQLEGLLMDFLSHVAASRGLYARVSAREAELLLRYHCGGVMFLLRDWKEQDTAELDAIAHRLYQMMIREENPL